MKQAGGVRRSASRTGRKNEMDRLPRPPHRVLCVVEGTRFKTSFHG